jgi:hypothetical protein
MKHLLISSLVLICSLTLGLQVEAATPDRNYSVSDSGSDQRIDIYNDGRNTFIQAVPGLIIKGATADGDKLIICGTPQEIRGWKDGKAITLSRLDAQRLQIASSVRNSSAPTASETQALNNRLNQITQELSQLIKKETATASTDGSWEIRPDDLAINPTIRRWPKTANWQVAWEIPVDYPVTVTDTFTGTFESAVARVVTAYEGR